MPPPVEPWSPEPRPRGGTGGRRRMRGPSVPRAGPTPALHSRRWVWFSFKLPLCVGGGGRPSHRRPGRGSIFPEGRFYHPDPTPRSPMGGLLGPWFQNEIVDPTNMRAQVRPINKHRAPPPTLQKYTPILGVLGIRFKQQQNMICHVLQMPCFAMFCFVGTCFASLTKYPLTHSHTGARIS